MSYRRNRRNYLMILVVLLLTTILVFAQQALEAMSPATQPLGIVNPVISGDAFSKVDVKYLKLGGMNISGAEIDLAKKTFDIKLRLDHAIIKGLDVTGNVAFRGTFEGNLLKPGSLAENLSLKGRLTATELVINNIPFHRVKLSFRLKNALLHILEFYADGKLKVYGKAYLKGPLYPIDITVVASNINIAQVLSYLDSLKPRREGLYSGLLDAKVLLKGPAASPSVKGDIEIRNGNIKELSFKRMTARFSGIGPMLKIEDSRITKESGFIVLSGDLDVRNLGKPNAFEAVDLEGDEEDIYLNENLNVGFKDCFSSGNADPRDKNNEVELGYNMNGGDSLKFRVGEDSGFFGLEHKEKF